MREIPDAVDVAVVGAGICGSVCAASVAARGASVLVIEKEGMAAGEQSGRAQGAIRVQGRDPTEIPLALEALSRWHDVAAEGDFELTFNGNMYLCSGVSEVDAVKELIEQSHASGLRNVRFLTPAEARHIIPAATGAFLAAMWSADDGQCQPAKATQFFEARARGRGARFAYDTLATKILERDGAVAGVATSRGRIAARAVVIAGGIWTSLLAATVGVDVPIMPVALSECETEAVAPLIPATLRAFRFGARQRANGKVVVSAGMNAVVDHYLSFASLRHLRVWAPRLLHHRSAVRLRCDWRALVDEAVHRSLVSPKLIGINRHREANRGLMHRSLDALGAIVPPLRRARIERYWAGVIDLSPDGLPIIDGDAGPAGMVLVTGLSGHGLALAPVIGDIAADLALIHATSRPIAPFSLRRFRAQTPIPRKMI